MNRQNNLTKNILILFFASLLSSNALCANNSQIVREGLNDYYLGPEDELEISVWNEDKLTRKVLVRPDGRFSFPLVGEVEASGITPDNVRKEIEKKISKYIPDPVVTVLVTKVASYKVYVIGQVKKPGNYNVGRYVDVMQALAMAGGLTPFASEDNIKILRSKRGKHHVIPFKYSEIKNGRKLEQIIGLKSGDVIVVP